MLAPEDDVLMIPLCRRCVDGHANDAHSALKKPDAGPTEPPRHSDRLKRNHGCLGCGRPLTPRNRSKRLLRCTGYCSLTT